MGTNTNIGQQSAVTVFGNPESFKKLIDNHGQLCKIKQAIACPCVADNHGSPNMYCEICNGDGFTFTYQRRFLVTDENSKSCGNKLYPYWNPILSVKSAQNVTSEIQGGITDLTVSSFNDTSITLSSDVNNYEKKRVTYEFDGWTLIENDQLVVDETNKLMIPQENIFDAEYQSSNPLQAYADIVQIVKIWNSDTLEELANYSIEGNTISTTESISSGKMYANYYVSDLTKVITTEITTRNNNEVYTHDLTSGEVKMAFYPFWELARGDIIVLSAMVLYKNEFIKHIDKNKNIDRLHEIEVFDVNDIIIDSDGNKYYIDTDYILQGRNIKWIGNKPEENKTFSVRYGYKPSFIVFEDNPQPLTLENKQYPKMVLAKSWSKIDKDDIAKLMSN